MRISFFEEYPTDINLSKLKIIPFKTNLYLGCKTVSQFLDIKVKIKKSFKNVDKVIYWPILKLEEGYWISAFSKTSSIKRVLKELKTKDSFPVLWDAEVPTLNRKLFITQILSIISNRKLIHKVLQCQSENHPLVVAEWPRYGINKIFSIIAGVSFSFTNYHRLDMVYTSLLKVGDKQKYLRQVIVDHKRRYKHYSVGLGLIGRGEADNITPLISPEDLNKDLKVAQEEGIKEVVLYRLGGLDNKYVNIIKNYADL